MREGGRARVSADELVFLDSECDRCRRVWSQAEVQGLTYICTEFLGHLKLPLPIHLASCC